MADFLNVCWFIFVSKSGGLGSYFQFFDFGQGIDDFFGNVIVEVFVFGVCILVDERQDSNRSRNGLGSYFLNRLGVKIQDFG